MGHAVDDHTAIHEALESGDAETVANLIEDHVNSFDAQVRDAVTTRLTAPLA
jgi:DNA-binding GntR family transcriptional regulator